MKRLFDKQFFREVIMAQVWRILCSPECVRLGKKSEQEVSDFFRKENIVGIDCLKITSRDKKTALRECADYYRDGNSKKYGIRAIMGVNMGDFIWFKDDKNYYLLKVDKPWKDNIPKDYYEEYTIGQFVSGTWVEVSRKEVPQKITKSFVQSALRRIKSNDSFDVLEITSQIWERKNQ